MIENRRMYVNEVAVYRGTCISSARKWMAALERSGSPAVKRDGRKLFTTEEGLRSLEPHPELPPSDQRLATIDVRLQALAGAVRGAIRRLNRLEEQLGIAGLTH